LPQSDDENADRSDTMDVAVIGGTGVLGQLVAASLVERGDTVRIVSRGVPAAGSDAAALLGAGAEHRAADLRSGDGLATALDGVEAVLDAANDTSSTRERDARRLLVEGTRRLLAAEAAAGVAHHVAISIVGCDRVPLGYYRAKVAQEEVVAGGPVAWSLLRATQFHQLLDAAFTGAARKRILPVSTAKMQPIDPAVVARRLVDAIHAGPSGQLPEIGGPRVQTLGELAAAWRGTHRGLLLTLPLPLPPRLGRPLRGGSLCAPDAAVAGPDFAQWLAAERRLVTEPPASGQLPTTPEQR
jgi:uncharacterized protein YbjT (DUF2867 family)